MKRMTDILLTLITAPLWLPLCAITALGVALTMGKPVIFRQQRAGKDGKTFDFMKFRTMREGDGPDAERLTPFGRFLRSTSLDELPQLFHVLSGKMSLVGPRPLPSRYLPRYSPQQSRRHEVRPGMTGWAQINGRNSISWEEKFRLDVWYVDNRSLPLDLKILFRTVFKTASRDGINHPGSDTMEEFTGAQR
jgi:lipopolysaccharide/colanic/teichoic acid biosynthesis glycosyltransferase